MADPPSYPETDEDIGVRPERATGTPRWVSVAVVCVVVLVVVVMVVLHITGAFGSGSH